MSPATSRRCSSMSSATWPRAPNVGWLTIAMARSSRSVMIWPGRAVRRLERRGRRSRARHGTTARFGRAGPGSGTGARPAPRSAGGTVRGRRPPRAPERLASFATLTRDGRGHGCGVCEPDGGPRQPQLWWTPLGASGLVSCRNSGRTRQVARSRRTSISMDKAGPKGTSSGYRQRQCGRASTAGPVKPAEDRLPTRQRAVVAARRLDLGRCRAAPGHLPGFVDGGVCDAVQERGPLLGAVAS